MDAELFFGREKPTGRLLDLACDRRFTTVFGPSRQRRALAAARRADPPATQR
ncbi:hypothetical protein [Streptomyces sp. GC420]|uniref:hypothetical protein n=1 Tax=Streptomyces sp. GC420 TaxID=2697568 RepID=UPI0037D9B575